MTTSKEKPLNGKNFVKINAIHMALGALMLVAALSVNDFMKHILEVKGGKNTTSRLALYAVGTVGLALGVSYAAVKWWGIQQSTLTTIESGSEGA